MVNSSWTYLKDYLTDKKKRLEKCKPKWDELLADKIKGDEKCQETTSSHVEGFMSAYNDTFIANKTTYYTTFQEWFTLWMEKNEFDRMCSVKPKNFRFAQMSTEDEATINSRKIFEQHFKQKHTIENLENNKDFMKLENQLMSMQYEEGERKKQQMRFKEDEEEDRANECEDCIKVPEKFAFTEVRKYWKILMAMQSELGELW
jgi:hypothetical protein